MMVGRGVPSTQTPASTIESMAKGTTRPEGAIETTISAGDNRGKFYDRSPADKLLLVERGGFGMMYNQTKPVTSELMMNQKKHDSGRGNHGR